MTDELADLRNIDLPFDIDKVAPKCHECVRKQIEKYKNHALDGKAVGQQFLVPCTGIPKDLITPIEKATKSDEELDIIKALRSKVEFAKQFIKLDSGEPWVARWYQENVLDCTSRRKILRIGRRCLAPGSMILMADGTQKPIEKINIGECVVSFKNNEIAYRQVVNKFNNGIQDIYEIILENNMSVKCTANHPLLIDNNKSWFTIENGLVVGNKIVVLHKDKFTASAIKSIKHIGESPTYDITVEDTHNFIANGITVSNSGKTDSVCIEIIYKIYTNENRKILVTGPQKVHVQEIFTRILSFIQAEPFLSDSVLISRAAPFPEIILKNGSRVRGFAGGVKGKKDASSVRGQDADDVYCVPKGTLVNTSEFAVKPIEKFTLEDTVLGGNKNGVEIGDVQNLGTRFRNIMKIHTAFGQLQCTPDHPLFDGKNDIPAEKATEVICSLYYRDLLFSPEAIEARLLGYLYGDGWITHDNIVGFSGQKLDLEQIQEDLLLLGVPKTTIDTRVTENKNLGIKGVGSQFRSSRAYTIFKDLHPQSKKIYQPLRVPKKIMHGRDFIKRSFLSGLFSAEGEGVKYQTNNRTPKTIRLNMRSLKEEWISRWIKDLSILLNESNIHHRTDISYTTNPKDKEDRFVGTITICNAKDNIQRFVDKIGFCYSAQKTISANIYKLFRQYEEKWKSNRWKQARLLKKNISKTNKYNRMFLEPLLTPKAYIDKITWKENYIKLPITYKKHTHGTVRVYNMTSGASNRFFASGYETHNCEEMDYVDETAIRQGILPVLQTNPNTSLVGFSTPSGFKTVYYELCEKNPRYKEFHYSYKVLPWADEVEKEKPAFTEEAWSREYLAEWGETESGVYQPRYVEAALDNYSYDSNRRINTWRYIIGTDWNEKYGTEIVVLGFNPFMGTFKVVDAVHIEKSEFTQLEGVSNVIEMNKKWKPDWIYIDAGNGSSNAELLRKTSWNNRKPGGDRDTARILDILVKYDSGSKVEVKDPVTKQKLKKPAKPYMVSSSVRLFEQGLIKISNNDKKLIDQLGNYIIDRINPNGVVVYGVEDLKVGDHRLDALNLACVGFHLQYDDLNITVTNTAVAAVPDPRIEVRPTEGYRTDLKSGVQEVYKRRLDYQHEESVLKRGASSSMAGKTTQVYHVPTNRPGWAEDREEEVGRKYIQRYRNRKSIRSQRPKRTNI